MSMADADIYSNPSKGSTRRTASSHIPVPSSRRRLKEVQHCHSAPEPSRLLVMQNQFQKRLLEDREAKLIEMYRNNQDAALGRMGGSGLNGHGIVRDFFRERHEIEQSDSSASLDRTQHFQWKKRQTQTDLDRMEREKEAQLHRLKRVQSERALSLHRQSGPSRSNPLAPIGKGRSQSMKNLPQPPSHGTPYGEPPGQTFGYNRKYVQSGRGLPGSSQTETRENVMPNSMKRSSKARSKPKSEPATLPSDPAGDGEKMRSRKFTEQPDKSKTRYQGKPRSEPSRPRIVDSDQDDHGYDVPQERKSHYQLKKTRGNIPMPNWKPHATYSDDNDDDDDDESDHSPPPYFPKAARGRRKQDQPLNRKRPSGSTVKQMSEFQKWQLEQDLERTDRLQRYQKKSVSKRQPKPDYRLDREMEEQKARQQQRKKELDDVEHHQRQMRELEAKIARKQLELSKLAQEANSEPSLSPVQSNPYPKPKISAARNSKQQRSSPYRTELGLPDESPKCDGTSPIAVSEAIVAKPAKLQPSQGKSKINRSKPKQNPAPLFSQEYDELPQTSNASYYTTFADTSEDAVVDLDRQSCPICGRHFAPDRLTKHTTVCQKTAKKKPRKVFDTRKQRLEGTGLAAYAKHGHHREDDLPKKKSNWREKHSEFIRAIRDARKFQNHVAKGGDPRELPPPAPTQHSEYKQCPHCQRHFDPTVAERHIPKCQRVKSRPAPPKKTGRR